MIMPTPSFEFEKWMNSGRSIEGKSRKVQEKGKNSIEKEYEECYNIMEEDKD